MKKVMINDELFNEGILITYGSMEEMNSWYKKNKIDKDYVFDKYWYAITEKITEKNGEYWHIHFTYYGFTTIVHETNHLAFEVLNKKGITLSTETMEIFAYYQDWIAGKCRDYLEKWTKKPKKKLTLQK